MEKNLGKTIKEALGWNTGMKLFIQCFSFIVSIFVARILDPKDFGIMAIGLMITSYINSITNFGFNQAIVQSDEITTSQINSVFTIDLFISVILTVLTLLGAKHVADYFNSPECVKPLRVLSIIFLLTTFVDMPKTLLRRSLSFKFLSIVDLLQSITKSLTAIVLALLGLRYWALIWSHILPMFLAAIVLYSRTHWRPRIAYSHVQMKNIYHFGIWNFFRAQLYYINKYMLQFIVGRSMGLTSLGYFDKAHSMSRVPVDKFGLPVNAVMFSGFSRMQKDKDELRKWFKNLFIIQCVFILPFVIGLFSVAPHFIIVLLGEKWGISIVPLQILSLAAIFGIFNGGIASFNIGVGNYKRHSLRVGFGSILLFISCLYSIRWGLKGVSYSFLLVSVIWFLMILDLALKHISVSFSQFFLWISQYLFANLTMLLVVKTLAVTLLSQTTITNFIILIITGGICFCSHIVFLNLVRGNDLLFPLPLALKRTRI